MRILIVKTSSMGDVVHALPLAVDIAHTVPDARIGRLCEEAFAAIPAMSWYVRKCGASRYVAGASAHSILPCGAKCASLRRGSD